MTLYELTNKYGKGKGEGTMWSTIRIVSDAVESGMDEKATHNLMRKVYGIMSDGHYNEEYSLEDVSKMYYEDEKGQEHYAPYWTVPQVKAVYESVSKMIPSEYNFWDFYVVLQMQKSDLYPLYHEWFPEATPDALDKRFVDSAVHWLNDKDAPHAGKKIWYYING